jgi:hypothetical protein
MALSDGCFDFLRSPADAADVLADAVHHYAAPGYPISYGGEIDALRRACAALRERPYDPALGRGPFAVGCLCNDFSRYSTGHA